LSRVREASEEKVSFQAWGVLLEDYVVFFPQRLELLLQSLSVLLVCWIMHVPLIISPIVKEVSVIIGVAT